MSIEYENREAASLARNLFFSFELKKYKKGEELFAIIHNSFHEGNAAESLVTICQFINSEYCRFKKAPLWGLKYCEALECQQEDSKIGMQTIVDNIIRIAIDYNNEIVIDTNKLLNLYKFDFAYLCRSIHNNNVLEGFYEFMQSNSNASIGESEFLDFICWSRRQIQLPIYLWTENDATMFARRYREAHPIQVILAHE